MLPLRILLIPRLPFTGEELAILDGPTASPFVSHFHLSEHQRSTLFCTIFLFFVSSILFTSDQLSAFLGPGLGILSLGVPFIFHFLVVSGGTKTQGTSAKEFTAVPLIRLISLAGKLRRGSLPIAGQGKLWPAKATTPETVSTHWLFLGSAGQPTLHPYGSFTASDPSIAYMHLYPLVSYSYPPSWFVGAIGLLKLY